MDRGIKSKILLFSIAPLLLSGCSQLVIVYRGGKRPLAPAHPSLFLDNSIFRNYDGRKRRNSDGSH